MIDILIWEETALKNIKNSKSYGFFKNDDFSKCQEIRILLGLLFNRVNQLLNFYFEKITTFCIFNIFLFCFLEDQDMIDILIWEETALKNIENSKSYDLFKNDDFSKNQEIRIC